MPEDRGAPLSFLCCGRCAHSMARARRQPDVIAGYFQRRGLLRSAGEGECVSPRAA
jgi:hypothetical protein